MMTQALRRKTFAVVLLTVVLSLSPSSAQERIDANGSSLYTGLGCETCHGAEGQGSAAGPTLAPGSLPLSEFIAYTRTPTGTMQEYRADDISDVGLTAIYAYLESQAAESAPVGRADGGAVLYRKTGCYECHADEAQGGAQGPRLGPDPVTLAMFIWYTRYPTGSMPPYTTNVMSIRISPTFTLS